MKGFRKCGIYPLNPGEISDRQLAPSHAFRPPVDSKSVSKEDEEQEKLYQKHYEEGYDQGNYWPVVTTVIKYQLQSQQKNHQHHLLFPPVHLIQIMQV